MSKPKLINKNPLNLYVVKLFDKVNNQWMDISNPVAHEEAMKIWNEKTDNGTKNLVFADKQYFCVFPADNTITLNNSFGYSED